MPKHAFTRSKKTRLFATSGAVAVGAFALSCAVMPGTALAATSSTATPAANTTSAAKTASASGTATTTYTVKWGDTLFRIARTHNVQGGYWSIAKTNHIANPNLIYPGQVLTLPAAATGTSSSSTTTTGTSTTTTSSSSSSSTAQAVPASATTPAPSSTSGSTSASGSTSSTSGTSTQTYANNLDGWIKQSLAIMAQNGIPGTYNGIYRNVMRESSGNPNAINLWDSNAAAGHPSKGLLQTIQSTFDAYHVPGTSYNIYDPVANITAACNYAYHRYGSIDNVNGPY